jgi:hypothetical protein
MQQYFWNFVKYLQDNWVQWLQLSEFASNNHTSETINCSEMFGHYGFHLWITFHKHPIKDPNNIRMGNAQ